MGEDTQLRLLRFERSQEDAIIDVLRQMGLTREKIYVIDAKPKPRPKVSRKRSGRRSIESRYN